MDHGDGIQCFKREAINYQSSGRTHAGSWQLVLFNCVPISMFRALKTFFVQSVSDNTRVLSENCSRMLSIRQKHWNCVCFIPIQLGFVHVVSSSLNLLSKGMLQVVKRHTMEIPFCPFMLVQKCSEHHVAWLRKASNSVLRKCQQCPAKNCCFAL